MASTFESPATAPALAADLPAAVLADLLGMHINTAVRWVKYVGRDWAGYIAARAIEQGNPAQDDEDGARMNKAPRPVTSETVYTPTLSEH
jgi:hypothetical protein